MPSSGQCTSVCEGNTLLRFTVYYWRHRMFSSTVQTVHLPCISTYLFSVHLVLIVIDLELDLDTLTIVNNNNAALTNCKKITLREN